MKTQIVYFSHGGGPLPILGDPGHPAMVEFMQRLPAQLARPDAVLVVSAHWEEGAATLLGASNPPMLYDYYGFPAAAYRITYPASGHPQMAKKIAALLQASGIAARIDGQRGFDHGLFIPLRLMYPEADIPCLQLSLLRGLDPEAHLRLGEALGGLREDNLLVVGSGFSFHNMAAFSWQRPPEADPRNDAFQQWLIDVCTGEQPASERRKRLADWEAAPSARYCHPREEHLLPLHVCAGLADTPAKLIFDDYILGKRALGFRW